MGLSEGEDLFSRYLKIFIVVTAYWVISILTVFVNKLLLSGDSVGLEAPLFITWFQCVVSYLICVVLNRTGGVPHLFVFPKGDPWHWQTFKQVAPLSVLFTGMIATNNLCLKYVDVSFYYVGRSLTTVFNVLLTWLLLRQTTSVRCLLCCLLIVFGFVLGVDQESLIGSFSLVGTVFGVVGSLLLSLYSIYTKKVLPSVRQEVWLLSYYNNAYSLLVFLPLMAVAGELQRVWHYQRLADPVFWAQLLVGGVCGFAIGYVTSLQIQVTSPLTHNISGTAKACAQTVIATQWYAEHKSPLWWMSNAVVLVASAAYAAFKQREMEARAAREERAHDKQRLV